MFKIKVNDKYTFEIQNDKNSVNISGKPFSANTYQVNDKTIHILYQNKSYLAEAISVNKNEKTCIIKVNANTYKLSIKDQFDELLQQLGLDNLNLIKISDLKAPMPGLILRILVKEGDDVKKGDNLLVLEAMKMENIIKSPANLKIKSIKIKVADKLEKNQVMIFFE